MGTHYNIYRNCSLSLELNCQYELLWLMRFYNAVIKTLFQDKYRINSQQMTFVLEKLCKFVN